MYFDPKTVTLKNGKTAILRSPRPEDAAELLDYMRTTAGETNFLLRTPEECAMTEEQERKFLQGILEAEDMVMIVCEVDGQIAGNCQLTRKARLRNRHRATTAIALLQKFWGLGIGTAMFWEMIAIGEKWGLLQLELEFVEGNHRAQALYEKMGFRTVAAKPDAIRLADGTLLKEFYMIRKL